MSRESKKTERILKRVLEQAQTPGLWEALTEHLSPSDLQSLLLEVYRKRTGELTPKAVLQQYQKNRFVKPAGIKPETMLEFDRLAYSLLPPGYETLELSPVSPLGSVSVLSPIDQNNTLSTIRNTEVSADSTNVMALESAVRRKAQMRHHSRSREIIRLCSSQRLLRTQVFEETAAFPHFRVFCLTSAGRDEGSFKFEISAVKEHIEFYIHLLESIEQLNLRAEKIQVRIFAFDHAVFQEFEKRLLPELQAGRPGVAFTCEHKPEQSRGYYQIARYHIFARDTSGEDLFLTDGGFTDWTQRLLGNRKERFLISGLGSERLLARYQVKT